MAGILYLCATPIGNLEDMTYRCVRILKEVDLIAAEDTRNSIKLLNHFEIDTPMTSYHEFNKIEKAHTLLAALKDGKNIACITAVTSSGQACRRFSFEAFLPKDKKERARVLAEMQQETRTMIVYEAPHHLRATLQELYQALGDRSITLCRELTKRYEEKKKMTLAQAVDYYRENDPRGEYVLVIAGKSKEEVMQEEQSRWEDLSIEEHMQIYLDQDYSKKDAMKAVAKDRGVSKRDIHQALL